MPREVDCRGLNCPQPVINTKKALDEITSGQVVTIVDNPVARQNVTLFARNSGYRVEDKEDNGNFYITITKGENNDQNTKKPESPQDPGQKAPALRPVYMITTNCFGQGSPDLGTVLMKSLMLTLAESDPAPEALIFINSGVYLVSEGAEVLPHLQKLAKAGTRIIACGTCLDYYRLREKLAIGTISNMYEINSKLTGPNKVITIA